MTDPLSNAQLPLLVDFEGWVGRTVRIEDDFGNTVDAVLRLAEAVTGHGDNGAESFSVVFELPGPQAPQQGNYTFHLPGGREQMLFVTPVQCPTPDHMWLESVLNFHPEGAPAS